MYLALNCWNYLSLIGVVKMSMVYLWKLLPLSVLWNNVELGCNENEEKLQQCLHIDETLSFFCDAFYITYRFFHLTDIKLKFNSCKRKKKCSANCTLTEITHFFCLSQPVYEFIYIPLSSILKTFLQEIYTQLKTNLSMPIHSNAYELFYVPFYII